MAKSIRKICFISPKGYPVYNPECREVFGGAEVDLYHIATELAKDPNYQVSCIVADYGQTRIESIENVSLIKSLNFKSGQISGAKKIWQAMKDADADIYFIKTASAGTFLAALFCKTHKKKFVYRSAHTDHCDGTWLKKHPLAGRFFKWALKHAAVRFVQNESDITALKATTGLDSIAIANAHRPQPQTHNERKHILWAGRSAKFKQPELFIELASLNPDYHFVMICQRSTCDTEYNRIKEKAIQIANLEFIERVPYNEIGKYFAEAKMLVNTSTAEGFPNTFIQAAMAGAPILSLNVDPDGFLEKHKCGICTRNTKELNTALETIIENFHSYSEAAIEYANVRHNISTTIVSYKKVFESL